ncbi:MAG: flagellar biosynthetic protein FliR [Myxococcota bacterium]|nr:flagellar biosynthetic protein FliR [Myxococcota bacterium]
MQALLEQLGGGGELARAIGVALLVAARVAPLTILVPWIALRGSPPALRIALLLSLTVALTPIAISASPPLPPDLLTFVVAIAREVAIGAVFAITISVPLYALDQAGRLVDAMRGASQSESESPAGDRTSPLGNLHLLLGAVLFVALGGHRLVIAALGEGLIDVPAGAAVAGPDLAAFTMGAARIVVSSLTLAVSFAAPAAVALIGVEVGLGIVGRAAPAIPMYFAGMPLRAAAGVAAVLLGLSVLVPHLPAIMRGAVQSASSLVGTLGG